MSYTKTSWANGQAPAINATNLNKIEQGIYDAHENKQNKLTAGANITIVNDVISATGGGSGGGGDMYKAVYDTNGNGVVDNAEKVNGHTVQKDVPSDAVFTDTVVTESTVSGWGFTKNTGTYSKPSGGIPKTDLASAVQTSLGKADSALQEHLTAGTGITISGTTISLTRTITVSDSAPTSADGNDGDIWIKY